MVRYLRNRAVQCLADGPFMTSDSRTMHQSCRGKTERNRLRAVCDAHGNEFDREQIKKVLIRLIDSLELPPNPLDQLTELLGGESAVAEVREESRLPASPGWLSGVLTAYSACVVKCAPEGMTLKDLAL